ncbi:MAG: sugar phosphorylase [Limnobacter sp.]|nr:sugar phosphorylase [Limnobacter sp.]
MRIYPGHDAQELTDKAFEVLGIDWKQQTQLASEHLKKWDQKDVYLITYGDSIASPKEKGLKSLHRFFDEHLKEWFTGVHILPFHPFTSDDGFAVSDFETIREDLGDWSDIAKLSENCRVMGDLVVNHISSEHPWFTSFLEGTTPGIHYICTANPDRDISQVVRPRSHPLLQVFETRLGQRSVWCTFSRDQVDLNFSNPDVFLEMLRIVLNYVRQGIRTIRLDAVGFIWKEENSSCISLPQAHWIVQAMRAAVTAVHPDVQFITETNVPLPENLSYFGDQDEAHMIYNFSLAPVLAHAILSGQSSALRKCLTQMPSSPAGCAFFNFTASHDGIGLRPAENLLTDIEIARLIDHSVKMGGEVTYRQTQDQGLKAYEMNVTLASLLRESFDHENKKGLERFILSQAIAMAIEGIPAIYIQSIFACLNDRTGFEKTGMARRINRKQWGFDEAVHALNEEPRSSSAFRQLTSLLAIRQGQPAFHPNATQYTLNLGPHLLGVWRESLLKDQNIFCVFNLSSDPRTLILDQLNLIVTHQWHDLISHKVIEDGQSEVQLAPYQMMWISNKDGRLANKSKLLQTYEANMPL